jgi:hypothetical protein
MNYKTDEQENWPTTKRRSLRRLGIVAAGIGLGSVVAYLLAKALGQTTSGPVRREHIVDDRGTGQEKAARMLMKLRDRAFDASDEKLAIALGRPVDEITGWSAGHELIDDDVIMKVRGIAMHRGVAIE